MPSRGVENVPAVPLDVSQRWVDIRSYGALCDGATDDTNALNAALTAVQSMWGAGQVLIPAGRETVISGAQTISIPDHCGIGSVLEGPFDVASIAQGIAPIILVTSTAASPFSLTTRDAFVRDVLVHYPNQIAPTSGANPTVYPPTFATPSSSAGGKFRRITTTNAYQAFQLYGGRHWVKDCLIGSLSNPFLLDHSLDVIRLDGIQCSPLWNTVAGLAYPQNIDTWVGANHTSILVKRADYPIISKFFAFHGNIGINIIDGTDNPSSSYGTMSQSSFDTFSVGARIQSTQSPGWRFLDVSTNASAAPVSLPSGGNVSPKVFWRGGSFWGAATTPSNAANALLDIDGVEGYNHTSVATGEFTGSGVPSASIGQNGDRYWRVDTPGTANQRLYVKSAGAWVGVL